MRKHHLKRTLGRPVVIAMAVAVLGMLAMLIVDHGPWGRPQVQTAEVANYKTTGEAARREGDADCAQAGTRTRCARAETGSAGKPCHALGRARLARLNVC